MSDGWLSQITKAVTGTLNVNVVGGFGATDVTDRADRLVGHVTVDTAPAVSGTVTANPATGTVAGSTASLVTTSVTANQVVTTYTVTAGKTLFLQVCTLSARLTTLSTTGSILGTVSLRIGGTVRVTFTVTNPTVDLAWSQIIPFGDLPIPAGTVVEVVVTPAATTSMTWIGSTVGFEQ